MTALIARSVPAQTTAPTAPDARRDGGRRDNDHVDRVGRMLLTRLGDLPDGSPDRPRLRGRVIEWYLPLAQHLARRFTGRGESAEDLTQVATIGLIKAVDGFDLDRGVEFTGYAVPTIVGELKRHFRDKGWSMRVPRRLQELKLAIGNATAALTQELGRSPTVTDLAVRLEISEDEVLEGLESANAYTAISLSTPVGGADGGDEAGTEIGDLLGDLDPAMGRVEDRAALRPLIARLPDRERNILAMRFFQNMTQSQIAERIGVSQMHVSRLLSRTLATLREELTAAAAA